MFQIFWNPLARLAERDISVIYSIRNRKKKRRNNLSELWCGKKKGIKFSRNLDISVKIGTTLYDTNVEY